MKSSVLSLRASVLAVPTKNEIESVTLNVQRWANSLARGFEGWTAIGSPEDRRPIINSAIIGLDADDEADT